MRFSRPPKTTHIIKYIPLQQGLRRRTNERKHEPRPIIKYIPLQQGLRR